MNSRSAENETKANSRITPPLPNSEGEADDADHHPPGLDARVEVVDHAVRLARAPRAISAARRWPEARTSTPATPPNSSSVVCWSEGGRWHAGQSALLGRGRTRAAGPASPRGPGEERGLVLALGQRERRAVAHRAGQRQRHHLPLGSTRLRFSIHTGTSRTSGRRGARWYRPLLSGSSTSSPVLRVPSGNMMSESPGLQRVGHLVAPGSRSPPEPSARGRSDALNTSRPR